MDWTGIIQLIITCLFGGGMVTLVTIKDKKTEAILANMQKVIDEQRGMMTHKKDMYESILAQKDEENAELRKRIDSYETKLERKDEKIDEQYRINSSLRHKLDDANTRTAVAELLMCDIVACGKRNPPLGAHSHIQCGGCKEDEVEQDKE